MSALEACPECVDLGEHKGFDFRMCKKCCGDLTLIRSLNGKVEGWHVLSTKSHLRYIGQVLEYVGYVSAIERALGMRAIGKDEMDEIMSR